MAVTVLIVDDEYLARANLAVALEENCDWQVVGECARGDGVMQSVEQLKPQVIFLDIRMPGLDGLAVSAQLMSLEDPPVLVFVTAFDQHAVEAFELCALDYLLKPFDDDRLLQTIKRVEKILESDEKPVAMGQWQQLNDAKQQYLTQMAVRSVGKVQLVDVKDIIWMGSAGNYVELHLTQSCILHRVSLSYLEKHLDPEVFIRIHRTSIIRVAQVVEFLTLPDSSYAVMLKNGDKVSLSQRYKAGFLRRLDL